MIGERIFDRESLVRRFGVSRRLASRVVALLARKVDLTAAVLESAGRQREAEEMLLDAELTPAEGMALSQKRLQALARGKGVDYADQLRLADGPDGWRTIALADDLLAEQAEGAGLGGPQAAALALAAVAETAIGPAETQSLFTPQEVARLKLTVVTSQDPQERMEAMRKLVFAPIPAAEKAGLLVTVLIDPAAEARVRQEAVRSLEQIGFDTELADCLKQIFEGDDESIIYAVKRLEALLQEADEAERGVTLAVLLEMFAEAHAVPVIEHMLELIGHMTATLVRSPHKTEQFVLSALHHLMRHFDPLRIAIERVLLDCERHAEGIVAPLLFKEMARNPDPRVRSFLIGVATNLAGDRQSLDRLAEAALKEMLNPRLPERQRAYLRYGLVRLGEAAARVVLDALTRRPEAPGPELIRLLDVLCTEAQVGDEIVNQAARFLLNALHVADRQTRRLVAEARLCSDPRVADELRVQVAAELLANLAEFQARDAAEAVCRRLEAMGPVAMRPLYDFVVRRYPRDETEWGFATMARLAKAHGEKLERGLTDQALDFCMGLFDDPDAPVGNFTLTVACLCGYTPQGARRFDDALTAMRQRLGRCSYTFDIFDALAIMAGSPYVKAKHQKELFEVFDRLANTRGPERLGVVRRAADGSVFYEFGQEVLFDTRVLPAAVRGLGNICAGQAAAMPLRKEVVKRLLVLWEGVSHGRVVWSPGAIGTLINAMCAAGCSEKLSPEMRVRLGHSLLRFLKRVTVVRALGEICGRPASGPRERELCIRAAGEMLVEWETSDQQDDERRMALLEAMGKVAANPGLNSADGEVRHMRENVVQALFLTLRSGAGAVLRPLEALRDCPALPEEMRREIAERLSRALALAPSGGARGP